jgi:hypothetical protein
MNQQDPSKTTSVASVAATVPGAQSSSDSSLPAVMPSMLYLMIKAMQDGSNGWLKQLKETLDFEQEVDMTMIGGIQNKDGSWTVDQKRSFIQNIVTAAIDQGKDDAAVSRAEMASHIGNVAANGGAVAFHGFNAAKDTLQANAVKNDQLGTKNFSDQLEATKPTSISVSSGADPVSSALSPAEQQAKINEWKTAKATDSLEFNSEAALKLKTNPDDKDLKAVQENLKTRQTRHEDDLKAIAGSGQNRYYQSQMYTSILSNSVDVGKSVQQADAQEKKGKDNATETVFQQIQQTAMSQVDKLREQAAEYNQNAGQQIMTIGQLTPARA